ncbi:MAG: DUF5677 domain-containing protein [Nitrospinota bacterium]
MEAFRRLVRLQREFVEGLYILIRQQQVTSSLILLRCLLESSATLAWMSKNPDKRSGKYFNNRLPSVKERLGELGWQNEYRLYADLSQGVHADSKAADNLRKTVIRKFEVPPSLAYRRIGHLFTGRDGLIYEVASRWVDKREFENFFAPFLVGKTLDYLLTSLLVVFGEKLREKPWWRPEFQDGLIECERALKWKCELLWPYRKTQKKLF